MGKERKERREKENEKTTELALCPPPPPLPRKVEWTGLEVKLAAIAVGLNVRPRSEDMPPAMQERAFRCARALVDAVPHRRPNLTFLALALKKEFDRFYGPAWHCVVGKSFGSFVTHSPGGFVYFSLDETNLSFLLFNTHLRPL